jgi:hypothetical protein
MILHNVSIELFSISIPAREPDSFSPLRLDRAGTLLEKLFLTLSSHIFACDRRSFNSSSSYPKCIHISELKHHFTVANTLSKSKGNFLPSARSCSTLVRGTDLPLLAFDCAFVLELELILDSSNIA